jgi:hypothetical protein
MIPRILSIAIFRSKARFQPLYILSINLSRLIALKIQRFESDARGPSEFDTPLRLKLYSLILHATLNHFKFNIQHHPESAVTR